eukprot:g5996.t1
MDGITAQDFLENPELKVYVEDALRLVLAARPERPLDLIDNYLQSVLSQDNVVGREYTYINATVRNRRAFVRAVYEVFVGPTKREAGTSKAGEPTVAGGGFEQVDVVHFFGLVCPDFPEELITRVARIISEGSKYNESRHSERISMREISSHQPSPATSATGVSASVAASDTNDANSRTKFAANNGSPAAARDIDDADALPFEVFLRACNIYFCFQEFFEDVRALFGSLAFRAEGSGNPNNVRGGRADDPKVRAAREVNLRILLDQLQVMKAEPRNQLRYIDVRFTEAAARRGGLGDRVTLPGFLACLLLHSDELALGLLDRVPVDGYADRLEACPALWSDGRISPQSSLGDATDATTVEAPG